MGPLRLGRIHVLNYGNQRCPLLWKRLGCRLHQDQMRRKHRLMPTFTKSLMARCQSGPLNVPHITQRKKLFVYLGDHFGSPV